MDCKYITLVIASYITMFFFGVIENVKGVTFVLIKDIFQVSYDAQGYLVSMSWYGYVIFCLVCAFVIDRYGIKTAIVSGHALCLLGCIITPFMNHFVPVIIALMVVWMGFGFFEVGYNAFATVLFTENSAIYLNLMHSCYLWSHCGSADSLVAGEPAERFLQGSLQGVGGGHACHADRHHRHSVQSPEGAPSEEGRQ